MLEKLSKHHELWIKMLVNLDCDIDLAKDIIQDMYIKLYDKIDNQEDIMYGDEVNKYFVYTTLRNMYFNHIKRSNKYKTFEFIDKGIPEVSEYDYGVDEAEDSIIDNLVNYVSKLEPQYIRLFELVFGIRIGENGYCVVNGRTFRSVSSGMGVSTSHVFYHVKCIKRMLRNEFSEDALDYFNKEYDKIN